MQGFTNFAGANIPIETSPMGRALQEQVTGKIAFEINAKDAVKARVDIKLPEGKGRNKIGRYDGPAQLNIAQRDLVFVARNKSVAVTARRLPPWALPWPSHP